ncbi:transcriptional regulator [Capsulimonas corticalis]|uniref:Transcriptional regulator n=1 Tax=Capsulimonas corticalis TaxID=2219043 RepID=A0A402CR76_9BACT|nr:helix-turn-helix domain-containing protein [Capsulimonas corticalis]BDI34457.1 transcriptional regulator [Capsulimonas corticalis]
MQVTNNLQAMGDDDVCPIREILDRIGDKWSVLVISNLADETLRFNALKQRITGISQRMLTETVRKLERNGILTRTVYPTIPPRVEYSLTPLGQTVVGPIQTLIQWADGHSREILAARAAYDIEQEQPVRPIPTPY